MDLSLFLCNHVSFCLTYFEILWLATYRFEIYFGPSHSILNVSNFYLIFSISFCCILDNFSSLLILSVAVSNLILT